MINVASQKKYLFNNSVGTNGLLHVQIILVIESSVHSYLKSITTLNSNWTKDKIWKSFENRLSL